MIRVSKKIRPYLQKAIDSAILAVEVYNKPAVKFKSSTYIMLMVTAWTALFHAIFFKNHIKPYHKEKNKRFVKIENDYKHWELDECLRQFFKTNTSDPVRKNLEMFIPLRNKIEHRYLPELDANIFGECQAMLLNFDEYIGKEFGIKYCLRECLSFALQIYSSSDNIVQAIKRNSSFDQIKNYLENYRSTLSLDVIDSGKYSFKAFLIQVANHQSADAVPIQFINFDKMSDEQKEALGKFIAMVKIRQNSVINPGKFKAGAVIEKVQNALGNPMINRNGQIIKIFNQDTHRRFWLKYMVRPKGNAENKTQTNPKFCSYDEPHGDYLYTQDWIDFLLEKMKDESEYQSLYPKTKVKI